MRKLNEINKLIKSNIDATEKMKRVGAKVVEIISNAKAKGGRIHKFYHKLLYILK